MIRYYLLVAATFLMPLQALALAKSVDELANLIVKLLNTASQFLLAVVILIFFYGIVMNMWKTQEGVAKKNYMLLFWGVIALFIIVSLPGIINLLTATIFDSGASGNTPAAQPTFTP